ncbi:hypothetical protein ACQP3J_30895, partial [Escherichia coli]
EERKPQKLITASYRSSWGEKRECSLWSPQVKDFLEVLGFVFLPSSKAFLSSFVFQFLEASFRFSFKISPTFIGPLLLPPVPVSQPYRYTG